MQVKFPNDKTKQKKKGSTWPLLVLGAGGVLWYFWNKKKKEKALILAAQAQAEQLRLQQQARTSPQPEPSGTNSADARLRGMGINTGIPGAYQAGEAYKEIQ